MTSALAQRVSASAWPTWFVFSVVVGAVGALALAPFNLVPLAFVTLALGFVAFAAAASSRRAFVSGWGVGAGYFGIALHWIIEPFQVDAALHGWMAPFALIGLAGGLAIFWGSAFWLARKLSGHGQWPLILTWPLAELMRAYLFTGFPWASPPQALVDAYVGQALALFGPHGMMLAMTLVGYGIALPLIGQRSLVPAVGIFAAAVAASIIPPRTVDLQMTDQTLRLIQPNAPQHEKWDPERIPIFLDRKLEFAAAPGNPDWIIMPETALPYLSEWAQPAFDRFANVTDAPMVIGIQRQESGNYFNSLVTLSETGQVTQTYDKHHLVPFGEYMPFAWLFTRLEVGGLAARAAGAYTAGSGPEVLNLDGIGPILPLICYEAVFAQDVAAATTRPRLLLHLTNDAWFGDFAGPQQHLAQARMRAIEQGVPVARSANTGISAMIGPDGRVLSSLELNTAGFLDAVLPEPFPPTVYGRTGDWPWTLLLSALILGAVLRRMVGGAQSTIDPSL